MQINPNSYRTLSERFLKFCKGYVINRNRPLEWLHKSPLWVVVVTQHDVERRCKDQPGIYSPLYIND